MDRDVVELFYDICFNFRNKLQENKTETEDKIKEFEDVKVNLKCQLTTMTQNLLDTEQELFVSKSELQNCRHEIDVRIWIHFPDLNSVIN